MISPLLTDANAHAFTDDSISECEPCALNNSEKKLYNAIINSWNERMRQERFEAYIAMEKVAQAEALKLRGNDEGEDGDLRNHEVSGTAAHFAREMNLRPRRAAAEEREKGQKRRRNNERSDWSKRQRITEMFSNTHFDMWADIRNHTRGDEIRMIQATSLRCEQRKRRKMDEKREVGGSIWKKRQRIPHLLIVNGSWRNLRRPPGYSIRSGRPHPVAGSTSHKAAFKNDTKHPPTFSTRSGDEKSRPAKTSNIAMNRASASSVPSKRKAGSIADASRTATDQTPAPSAQSKIGGSSVKDNPAPVAMAEDGSRKVTKIHDLLN